VNARLAALLTAAHAPAWRCRYGGEFEALLVELPPHPAVVADALGSAAGTHRRALAFAGGVALAVLLVFLAAGPRLLPAVPGLVLHVPVLEASCTPSGLFRLHVPGGILCGRLG
jgi:hypothetical protein